MPLIDLKYGKNSIVFEYDAELFQVLETEEQPRPLTDAVLGEKLDRPVDSPLLEELVSPGQSVLIVVPDATRQTGAAQIVNLLIRRLIASGTAPHDIRIIFATGIHRRVTDDEKKQILTDFIWQRVKTLDHDPRDLSQIVRLGETSGGIQIELNRALVEHDRVILVGGVTFHYFAGFTGGRKLICPGLASARAVSATHKLAFDCTTMGRREGVGSGQLDGNAVHEAFMEAVARINPSFAINAIVNENGEAIDIFCGDWITSHRKACNAYAASKMIRIPEKRDLVIVSCGGYPHDINMIQAHKALDSASRACNDGGTIILIAECAEGLGRDDFLDWFESGTSHALARRLCEKYQVNGQTAWSLLRIAERFDVRVITSLDAHVAEKLRLTPVQSLAGAAARIGNKAGFILPFGAKYLPLSASS